ncbi:Ribosome-recycling factor [Psilocybe cubensis]|uniref:Ribosome recycling factor domain-containing protein n=2 Tax=Psilocybe cubensis TaxID=181762 RepID=A0A8H7XMT8_PSICU|nr:Ribosome-recycling factor [Psilocybe cubensis]KAH9477404.1 Ribosome-recycling factor [Psilocybe cubensis]
MFSAAVVLRNARPNLVRSLMYTTTTIAGVKAISSLSQFSPKLLNGNGHRGYATENKIKSTSSFVPGSKQPITDEAAQQEYAKAEAAMKTSVEWFRKECAASEARALGRVTPALLSPVRVKLPDTDKSVRLEELATVGVREGSTLLITLYDEHSIKHVEAALYDSGIPGVVPHRQDNRTIKVPIPKPTVEARKELFTIAKRKAEDIRVQIRKQHAASLKRGKYEKHSVELEEFQKLTDKYIKETDKVLADLQKATGGK